VFDKSVFVHIPCHPSDGRGGLRSSGVQKATKYDQPRAASSS